MKNSSQFDAISDEEKTHQAWSGFVSEMKHKHYGYEPIRQAWYFYKIGWSCGWVEANLNSESDRSFRVNE